MMNTLTASPDAPQTTPAHAPPPPKPAQESPEESTQGPAQLVADAGARSPIPVNLGFDYDDEHCFYPNHEMLDLLPDSFRNDLSARIQQAGKDVEAETYGWSNFEWEKVAGDLEKVAATLSASGALAEAERHDDAALALRSELHEGGGCSCTSDDHADFRAAVEDTVATLGQVADLVVLYDHDDDSIVFSRPPGEFVFETITDAIRGDYDSVDVQMCGIDVTGTVYDLSGDEQHQANSVAERGDRFWIRVDSYRIFEGVVLCPERARLATIWAQNAGDYADTTPAREVADLPIALVRMLLAFITHSIMFREPAEDELAHIDVPWLYCGHDGDPDEQYEAFTLHRMPCRETLTGLAVAGILDADERLWADLTRLAPLRQTADVADLLALCHTLET